MESSMHICGNDKVKFSVDNIFEKVVFHIATDSGNFSLYLSREKLSSMAKKILNDLKKLPIPTAEEIQEEYEKFKKEVF